MIMKFEHFALNVTNPKEQAEWYVKNCRMKIVKSISEYPFTHFLSDDNSQTVLELYSNNAAPFPDYFTMNTLQFHFAFATDNIAEIKDSLIKAGASLIEEIKLDDGSEVIMFRDPFGLAFQICKRTKGFFNL